MAKSGHKGISRIDCPERKTVGWYVRVRLGNVTKSKFFSDSKHAGKDAALERAVECRDEMEAELGKPRTDWVVVGKNPRNRSGVVGVRRTVKKHKGKDGRLRAFRMACAIRREKERLIYGEAVVSKWAKAVGKVCAA